MRKLMKLVLMVLFLMEIFVFKAKHFVSTTIIAGDIISQYLNNSIIGN